MRHHGRTVALGCGKLVLPICHEHDWFLWYTNPEAWKILICFYFFPNTLFIRPFIHFSFFFIHSFLLSFLPFCLSCLLSFSSIWMLSFAAIYFILFLCSFMMYSLNFTSKVLWLLLWQTWSFFSRISIYFCTHIFMTRFSVSCHWRGLGQKETLYFIVKFTNPKSVRFCSFDTNETWHDFFRVATVQGKQGIWFLLFPDRDNTGNFALTQGNILRHRENIFLWHREKFRHGKYLTVIIKIKSMFIF